MLIALALAAVIAQLVWISASLHGSAIDDGDTERDKYAMFGAFAVNIAAAALTLWALMSSSSPVAIAAAVLSVVSTATTAWYASTLYQPSALAKTGYFAAILSTIAAVLVLSSGKPAYYEERSWQETP